MVSLGAKHFIKIFALVALAFVGLYAFDTIAIPALGLRRDGHTLFYGGVAELFIIASLIVLIFDVAFNPSKELADEWAKSCAQSRADSIAANERIQRDRDRETLRRAVRDGKANPDVLRVDDDE